MLPIHYALPRAITDRLLCILWLNCDAGFEASNNFQLRRRWSQFQGQIIFGHFDGNLNGMK